MDALDFWMRICIIPNRLLKRTDGIMKKIGTTIQLQVEGEINEYCFRI